MRELFAFHLVHNLLKQLNYTYARCPVGMQVHAVGFIIFYYTPCTDIESTLV